MTKQTSLLFLFPALATTLLSAAPNDSDNATPPQDKNYIYAPLGLEEPRRKPTEGNYYSDRLLTEKSWDVFFTAEYLYWKAEQGGLEYGLRTPNFSVFNPLGQFNSTKGVIGNISHITSEYKSGYRLGLEIGFPYDQWDLDFIYTNYDNSDAQNNTPARTGQLFFPIWLDGNFDPTALSADARWRCDFSSLDIDLGRAFYAGKHFVLKPFVGFKAAWVKQSLRVLYKSVAFESGNDSLGIHMKNRSHMDGCGLDAGLAVRWMLPVGFYSYATCSGAIVWSKFSVHQNSNEIEGYARSHIKKITHVLTPQFALQGGFGWETQFKEWFYLNIHFGWDEQLWFETNQFYRFSDTYNHGKAFVQHGNLSLYGWTVGGTFGF